MSCLRPGSGRSVLSAGHGAASRESVAERRAEENAEGLADRQGVDAHAVEADGPSAGISVVLSSGRSSDGFARSLLSLAEQNLDRALFEVIVVMEGAADGPDGVADELRRREPDLTLRRVRLTVGGKQRARNVGVAAASRRYITFVEADDYVSPGYLQVLLTHARPEVVLTASVVEVGPKRESSGQDETFNGAKVVATDLIKDIRYDETLVAGADLLFWTTVTVERGVETRPCPHADGATYYRMVRPRAAVPLDRGFDVAVRQPVELMWRFDRLLGMADARAGGQIQERMNEQADSINEYLTRHPGDRGRMVELLDRRPIFHVPYERINAGRARGLVVAYAFPPFADASAVVTSKRVRLRGEVVDVISNEMSRIREIDESLRRISGPFVGRHAAVATPTYFLSWSSMERFAATGIDVIRGWEADQGEYGSVYSRAHFAASHFLAAAYKLSRPGVRWTAEFSDPLSRDVQNRVRGTPVRRGPLLRGLRKGMRRLGLPVPRSRNCLVWCEEAAYALADELVFTNEHQMEHMLSYCSNRALAATARRKAVIEPHPTLPPEFYSMVEHDYPLDAGRVHLGYFGNFYATRALDEVFGALAAADQSTRHRLLLHVFTSKPDELRARVDELRLSNCVAVAPYIRYLEFLNLTTKLDCLIVGDAATGANHPRNPYLPSKWSDYRGSQTPVWGLVEPGSELSARSLNYVSEVGDVGAAGRVLVQLAHGVGLRPARVGVHLASTANLAECYNPPPPCATGSATAAGSVVEPSSPANRPNRSTPPSLWNDHGHL